jgi:hypothetical protein
LPLGLFILSRHRLVIDLDQKDIATVLDTSCNRAAPGGSRMPLHATTVSRWHSPDCGNVPRSSDCDPAERCRTEGKLRTLNPSFTWENCLCKFPRDPKMPPPVLIHINACHRIRWQPIRWATIAVDVHLPPPAFAASPRPLNRRERCQVCLEIGVI